MDHDSDLLNRLQDIEPSSWTGIAFRHVFGENDPLRENTRGARWNPPEVPAIYTSLSRDGALAEADFLLSLQTPRPRVNRTIYQVEVDLGSVVDLSDPRVLARLGVSAQALHEIDWSVCQPIGAGVEWLGNDGLIVPSARSVGRNLVIFPNQMKANSKLSILDTEVIEIIVN